MFATRKLHIACTDSLGQKGKTFTVDENGKQNSPSFSNSFEFFKWTKQAHLYAFRVDLKKSNNYLQK